MSLDGTGVEDDIGGLDEISPRRRLLAGLSGLGRSQGVGTDDPADAPPIRTRPAGSADSTAPPPVRPARSADYQPGWNESIPALGAWRGGLLAPVPENFQGTAISDVPAGAGADIPAPPPVRTQPPVPSPAGGNEPPPISGSNILGASSLPRLGFKERQALPTISPGVPAGSAAFYENAIERIEDQKANPWGSPENHPGTLGKVGHVLGRVGNIAGDIVAPNRMAIIPGTDLNRDIRERGLENRFEAASTRENRAAETEDQRRIEERRNEILDRRNDILEGKQPKQTPDEGAIADLRGQTNPNTGRPYTAYEARVKLAQDIQDTKPAGHTSPFEAFAFGTPEEKKAAQDFLAFEKRMDRQNQKPTEAEFRYSLYQRDPETYKAMYGDKGQAADERSRLADRTHATAMLRFFQKQRDEISKDFMLGDDEKAKKLAEIDELEKPFMDTATAQGKDRVDVLHPDGRRGTIPRSQLKDAKKKGYREAPAQ